MPNSLIPISEFIPGMMFSYDFNHSNGSNTGKGKMNASNTGGKSYDIYINDQDIVGNNNASFIDAIRDNIQHIFVSSHSNDGALFNASYQSSLTTETGVTGFNASLETQIGLLPSGNSIVEFSLTRNIAGSGGGGGSGVPAGSNTQIQFNNSGSFGGSANLTFDGSKLNISGSLVVSGNASFTNGSFTNISGSLTGNVVGNVTGDITGSAGSCTGNAVTSTKIASITNSNIVQLTETQTLTNKTLTSAVLNTGVSGSAILDEDNMASNSATQLATQQSIKAYVDSVAQGLHVKQSCKVATTGNITLSGSQTIDSILVVDSDRVLVKDQSTGPENGIYVCVDNGSWTRSTDMANGSNAAADFVFIEQGTVNNDHGFVCSNASGSDVVGTNDLTFTQFSGAGQITAGNGLEKSGNTLSIDAKSNSGIVIDNNELSLDLSASSITGTLAVGDGGTGATTLDDLITLGTHTTGNYVATIADSGTGGITVANSGAESAAVTLEMDVHGLTTAAIASGDFIAFSDEGETGDPSRKETIDDIATLFAGDGLAASSAVMSLDLKSNGGAVIESNKLAIDLGASSITGTLAVGGGGTGATSLTSNAILTGNGTSAIEAESNLTFDGSTLNITGAITGTSASFTNGSFTNVDISGSLIFGDNKRVAFGDSNDLQIYHDGSNTFIDEHGEGDLVITATHLKFRAHHDSDDYFVATTNGSVDLYHNGSKTFETTENGILVSASLTTSDSELKIKSLNTSGGQALLTMISDNGADNGDGFQIKSLNGSLTICSDHNSSGTYNEEIIKFMGHDTDGSRTTEITGDLNVSNTITATGFSGPLTGNADTATTATNVTVTDESTDTSCSVLFTTAASGNLAPKSGSNLTFNSNTGALSATKFSGGGSDITSINGSNISSGTVDEARMATAQTNIQTIYNSGLKVGRDTDNQFDFSTDNQISVSVKAVDDEFRFSAGGEFHADGDITAFSSTTASDRRLKTNIKKIKYGLKDILKLNSVEFDWKEKRDGKHDIGFIAQEVKEVIPEIITEIPNLKDNTSDNYLGVDYSKVVPVLVESIKEQQEEINYLKQMNNELLKRLELLESEIN